VKIEIRKRSLDDLGVDGRLPFDDPHGLCRISTEMLAAFRENPFRQTQNEPAQLVGTIDGCAAGTLMLLPGELVVDGTAFPIAWCSGLYVLPEYRKTLLGIALVREARGSHRIVGGSRVSDTALPIFLRLGWIGIPLTRYIMPCRGRPSLEHALGPGARSALLSPLLDRVLALHRRLLKRRERLTCANLHCMPADSMPEALNSALAESSRPFGCHRSSRWLNWILHHSFNADPRNRKQLYLVHDRQERIVAYFVTRVKFHQHVSSSPLADLLSGSILDWGVFEASAAHSAQLLLMATNILTGEGVDVVEICQASPTAAMPFGFRQSGHHWVVLLSNSSEPPISKDQIGQWKLHQIDGDSGLS
jgi:hypothetical protein